MEPDNRIRLPDAPAETVLEFGDVLMAIGTGFLKTSCTTIVGFLYGERDVRRLKR